MCIGLSHISAQFGSTAYIIRREPRLIISFVDIVAWIAPSAKIVTNRCLWHKTRSALARPPPPITKSVNHVNRCIVPACSSWKVASVLNVSGRHGSIAVRGPASLVRRTAKFGHKKIQNSKRRNDLLDGGRSRWPPLDGRVLVFRNRRCAWIFPSGTQFEPPAKLDGHFLANLLWMSTGRGFKRESTLHYGPAARRPQTSPAIFMPKRRGSHRESGAWIPAVKSSSFQRPHSPADACPARRSLKPGKSMA